MLGLSIENKVVVHIVCKLKKKKILYGLKQASCAWFDVLKNFLTTHGFQNS